MISSKTQRQPQPKIVTSPTSSNDKVATMPHPVPSHELIRERAYQLYEDRGCEAGQHEQDWLRAEEQILKARK